MIGTIISDRYKLLKYIGGGGMSSVYLAEDIILNQHVAVKIINIPHIDVDRAVQRFEREVQNATTLSHPNIVKVLDIDEDERHYYMIMEYVDGPTLHEYIKENGPLSAEEAVFFAKQILRGIEHAHSHRIVHRDIKPQNILMTEQKELKISDFGIARALSETAMTQTNHIMGSVHYLSPEQAKGVRTDESSDIYSIGIVLYEMLTGHPPFEGESAVSIAIKHIQDAIPSVRTENKSIPQSLENVVNKATMKDKLRRYRTTQEMYDDLRTVLDESRLEEDKIEEIDDKTKLIPIVDDKVIKNEKKKESFVPVQKPKQNRKNRKWLLFLIPLILMFVLSAAVYATLFMESKSTVPELKGKSLLQATELLHEHNLRKGEVQYTYTTNGEKNKVIRFSPGVGEKVKANTKIDLTISKGQEKFEVKNYIGKNIKDVKKELEDANFKNVSLKEVHDMTPSGQVLKQSIENGMKVIPEETEIELTVSKGIEQIYVPDYTGKSFAKAKHELESSGFIVNVSAREYSDDIEKDKVISQDVYNINYQYGSQINFVVSKGKDKNEKQKDDKESKNDNSDEQSSQYDKTYYGTFTIPYRGTGDKQKVEIYIQDDSNDIAKLKESYETKNSTTKNFNLVITPDEDGEILVKIDGNTYMHEKIKYDDLGN
ncbi:Stk1 family PASTA domain-containing Ser/Thr kinase [Macrococcus armenti]|uniref:Stk1 family PASTA domain-containing Ser/Thr kinase n=1 Tax=Macrococcus armenti TaxID=2875764 RepID=UPI001CCB807E|nr:Stk1 family PASTA domain-containing Ser/Thr kinase [Macrococcus armenti]UBH16260.1 Stk1 family PASTA domain-containing Ser/Thr kinase [Macrococcus armenti]UBH18618.1 Stk1 family PASTA domain-containing Ser/Thr kinase [Macrococcus armenti]UBH20888.1 Stk1 family PASTA domain-containing Ser/Thr kinase [Macrococcus armenti]